MEAEADAQELHGDLPSRVLATASCRHTRPQVVSTRELEQLRVGAVLDLRQPPVRCKTQGGGMALTLR